MKKLPMPHESIDFFELNEAHSVGVETARVVADTLPYGRSLIRPWDAGLLCQMVLNTRHGDHVEIGSLFGGSAIVTALAKKEFGSHGKIYCVDPLETGRKIVKDHTALEVATKEALLDNAAHFGVADMIEVVQEFSHPWPIEGKKFATGYVDGDHWNQMPWRDAANLRAVCSYAIMFDDYCMGKPEVQAVVVRMCSDPDWIPVHISGLSAIFRRRM